MDNKNTLPKGVDPEFARAALADTAEKLDRGDYGDLAALVNPNVEMLDHLVNDTDVGLAILFGLQAGYQIGLRTAATRPAEEWHRDGAVSGAE